MIDLCLLGSGGTMPLPGRWLSCLLIRCGGELTLVDCGEAAQISLRMVGWGFRAINNIAITHFHADHIGGLTGMLLTIGHAGRGPEEPLTIFGPPGIGDVVEKMRVIAPYLPYPLVCRELTADPMQSHPVGSLVMTSAWGEHELPCLAYRFALPRHRAFDAERARRLGLPVRLWNVLQHDEPVEFGGRMVDPDEVLGPARPGLSVGFVTDSRPTPTLAAFFRGVDLLISEASYGDPADAPKALENKHMTFAEAAGQAKAAGARRLWLTHFSPSLTDPLAWLPEATAVFPDTIIGHDRMTGTLNFPK